MTLDVYDSLKAAFIDSKITLEQYNLALTGDVAREHYARVDRRESFSAWQCHYCGSLVPNSLYKCPSCAGERR